MRTTKKLNNDSGAILIMTTILLVVLIGMAALTIDVGQMYIARQRAQNVCDAAAIAGARSLDPAQTAATQPIAEANANYIALGNNEYGSWIVFKPGTEVQGVRVTFPTPDTIKTEGYVNVNYLFASVLGPQFRGIRAHAVAQIQVASGFAYPFVPIAVTDTIVNNLEFGEQQALKTNKWQEGSDAFIGPGNFSPVRFNGESGANNYRSRLSGSKKDPVELSVGDFLDTEPGNMVGPTYTGARQRLQSDTTYKNDATAWNEWSQTWDPTVMTFAETPRLVILPVIADPMGSANGMSEVEIVGFAGFFIESVTHTKTNDKGVKTEYVQLSGRFVIAAVGPAATGWLWWMGPQNSSNLAVHARLVE